MLHVNCTHNSFNKSDFNYKIVLLQCWAASHHLRFHDNGTVKYDEIISHDFTINILT